MQAESSVRYGTVTAHWVIAATVLGSGIAFLDSTVVNVALPAISSDFEVGFSSLQWTIDAYLLTLGALLLMGGSLGDLYGRKRMFVWGLASFTTASVLCGLAPTVQMLVFARAIQGVGAALLVPGSLAIISSSFRAEDRGRAIGAWSGLAGVATAIGPFLGGWMVDGISWRLIFLINVPLAVVAILIANRYVPETRDEAGGRPDVPGGLSAALGLGGIVFALIEGPERGWTDPLILLAIIVGAASLVAFAYVELHTKSPMLPFNVFRSTQFSAANGTTLVVYAALSGAIFLLVIQLQRALGYSALEAGAALFPITVLLLVLSSWAGRLTQAVGPRLPMTVGPLVAGAGLVLLTRVEPGVSYAEGVLPGVFVFGLGMSLTVAPLTTAVLAAIETRHAGIGSAVNNAVARIAGLLAIAVLPLVGGISGAEDLTARQFSDGVHDALWVAAAMCAVGAVISGVAIRTHRAEVVSALPASHDHPCEATAS
jgi:EmrB/QacA subfamily drug resistance transporter